MPSYVPARMPWAQAVSHVSAVMQCDRNDAKEELRVKLRDNVIPSFDALTDDPIAPAAWRGLIEIDETKRRLLLRGLPDGPYEVELRRVDVLRLWPGVDENDAQADVPPSPPGSPPEICGAASAAAAQTKPKPTPAKLDQWMNENVKSGSKRDQTVKECREHTGATWRTAVAAWKRRRKELGLKQGEKTVVATSSIKHRACSMLMLAAR